MILKTPPKQFFWHIVTVLSIGVIVLTGIFLLAENRKVTKQVQQLSESNKRLSEDNQRVIKEVQNSTDFTQRYLKCILLIPREDFAEVETRVAAIDKCAAESKLPEKEATAQRANEAVTPAPTSSSSAPSTSSPQTKSQPEQSQSSQSAQPEQPSSPSLIERVTNPIKKVLGL